MKKLLVVAISLAASVAQADDAEQKCINTLQTAWELALARAETVAELDRQVAQATPLWAQGKACGPKYRDLGDMLTGIPTALAKKQKRRADLVENEAIRGEADALEKKLPTADEATWKTLSEAAAKLDARMDVLQDRSEVATDARRRQLARAVADRRSDLDTAVKNAAAAATKAEHDQIHKGMVTARLGLTDTDAYDLAKVRDAFAKSSATDLVVTTADGHFEFAPAGVSHAKVDRMHFDTPPPRDGHVALREGRMQVFYASNPSAPPVGTPGLVWNLDGGDQIIFVSIDGARYEATIDSVTPMRGQTPLAGEVREVILTTTDIATLAKAGQVPAKTARELERLGEAASKCSIAVWKRAEPRFDAIAAADISSQTRAARNEQLRTKVFAEENRACGGHERGYRKLWTATIDARRDQRVKLLEAVRKLDLISKR